MNRGQPMPGHLCWAVDEELSPRAPQLWDSSSSLWPQQCNGFTLRSLLAEQKNALTARRSEPAGVEVVEDCGNGALIRCALGLGYQH